MNKICVLFGLLFFALACQTNPKLTEEKSVQEIKDATKIDNSSIIRNPVTASEPQDTVNVAKMFFEEPSYEFGEVKEGAVVTHDFKFTNTGKVPLLISRAKSTCGCTVPNWPKEPIPPGKGGTISVKFNTKNKHKEQRKAVTITANTYPSKTYVHISGYVIPKGEVN